MTGALSITVDVDGAAGLPGGGAGLRAPALAAGPSATYGLGAGLAAHPRRARRVRGARDVLRARRDRRAPPGRARGARREPARVRPPRPHAPLPVRRSRRPRSAAEIARRRREALIGRHRARAARLPRAGLGAHARHARRRSARAGFAYDSSLMGDDRPYVIEAAGGASSSCPVHWALDDAPHFAHTTDPAGLLAVWLAELAAADARGAPHHGHLPPGDPRPRAPRRRPAPPARCGGFGRHRGRDARRRRRDAVVTRATALRVRPGLARRVRLRVPRARGPAAGARPRTPATAYPWLFSASSFAYGAAVMPAAALAARLGPERGLAFGLAGVAAGAGTLAAASGLAVDAGGPRTDRRGRRYRGHGRDRPPGGDRG